MSRDVIKWREHLKELDAQICRKCGKPFSDYIHNLPEGRDDFANHEFEPVARDGGTRSDIHLRDWRVGAAGQAGSYPGESAE